MTTLVGSTALSQPSRPANVRLEVTSAPQGAACATEPELRAAVERHLDRPVFGDQKPDLTIRIAFRRADEESFAADVVLSDPRGRSLGEREIRARGRECHVLDPSLVLVLALLVESPPEPEPPTLPPPPRSETTGPIPPPMREAPSVRFTLAAAGAVSLGLLPGVAAGAELSSGSWFSSGWGLGLLAALYPYDEEERSEAGSGARFRSAEIGLEGCGKLAGADTIPGLFACLGASGGAVQARGFGFDDNRGESSPFSLAAARVGGFLGLGGGVLGVASLRAGVPLVRASYRFTPAGGEPETLFRTAPIALSASLGAGFALP